MTLTVRLNRSELTAAIVMYLKNTKGYTCDPRSIYIMSGEDDRSGVSIPYADAIVTTEEGERL